MRKAIFKFSFSNWDMILAMQVNKIISAKVSTGLIYNHIIIIMDANRDPLGSRTEFKEMFGAGLSVKF